VPTGVLVAVAAGPAGVDLVWARGTHQIQSVLSGTVAKGATVERTVTSTDEGPLSASLNWNPSTTTRSEEGTASLTAPWSTTVTATGPGTLSVYIGWDGGELVNPDLDLWLYDEAGNLVASSTTVNASPLNNNEVVHYTVASASRTAPRTFTVQVTAKTAGSTPFWASMLVPVTADLDLQLWSGSSMLASSASSARPETVSVEALPPGVYTWRVISRDHAAPYTLSADYQVLAHADVGVDVLDDADVRLGGARSASGVAQSSVWLPAAGGYTVRLTGHSPDLAVPGWDLAVSLPAPREADARLELVDDAGGVVATGTAGASGPVLAAEVAPGQYRLRVTPVAGAAEVRLTGAYPSFPARLALGYDGNGHATSVDDGAGVTVEALAGSGRVLRRTVTAAVTGEVVEDVVYGYDGAGDSPAAVWSAATPTAVTTYLGGPGGLLCVDTPEGPSWPLADGHGDLVADSDAAGAVIVIPQADEFGVGEVPDGRLGWLGAHQRHTVNPATGIIRMGVRLYHPTLGRFLAVDPVEGGSANDYDYCNADPINCLDLDGNISWRTIGQGLAIVGGIAGAIACGATIVCGIAVGAFAGAAAYTAANVGTSQFTTRGLVTSAALGGALGGLSVVGAGRAAASRVLAQPRGVGNLRIRVHFDRQVHNFPVVGNRSHWQANIWRRGVSGSGHALRYPVRRPF
jgi:RHS repeat-associated protein